MILNDGILRYDEKLNLRLREAFLRHGYQPYRMSKFEEYDFYADNKDFLTSDQVITFTDTDGKLLALKPDVTLSIIKNTRDVPGTLQKLFYSENVYRVSDSSGSFREIPQTGLECLGPVTMEEIIEVLQLAAESLMLIHPGCTLELSDLDLVERLISCLDLSVSRHSDMLQAIGARNASAIRSIAEGCNDSAVEELIRMTTRRWELKEFLDEFGEKDLIPPLFLTLIRRLNDQGGDMLHIDLSMIENTNYYNGIVFRGYEPGVPTAILSGGQYDRLMRKMRRDSLAIGFAVYPDRAEISGSAAAVSETNVWLNVALPKGRLGDKVYTMFAEAGYDCPAMLDPKRKLIFENPEKKIRFFQVKPSDVPIYVERGAADIGVAGKDILLEYQPDVYELADLGIGKCRMAVAAPVRYKDPADRTLRVATKFSRVAREYYRSLGRSIDIIHLNGSIEIAPILGLSDVIVDIVETGTTLKENNLEVISTVFPISARLIANKSGYRFKETMIRKLVECLSVRL